MTVKQVLEAQQVHPDADFTIDGVDVAQVSPMRWIVQLYDNVPNVCVGAFGWICAEYVNNRNKCFL